MSGAEEMPLHKKWSRGSIRNASGEEEIHCLIQDTKSWRHNEYSDEKIPLHNKTV
jgi:hypothetical protein